MITTSHLKPRRLDASVVAPHSFLHDGKLGRYVVVQNARGISIIFWIKPCVGCANGGLNCPTCTMCRRFIALKQLRDRGFKPLYIVRVKAK